MTISQEELEFKLIRCPNCDQALFAVTAAMNSFSIRVKCRNCSYKRGIDVYLILAFSLEQTELPPVDSSSNNFASAEIAPQ